MCERCGNDDCSGKMRLNHLEIEWVTADDDGADRIAHLLIMIIGQYLDSAEQHGLIKPPPADGDLRQQLDEQIAEAKAMHRLQDGNPNMTQDGGIRPKPNFFAFDGDGFQH